MTTKQILKLSLSGGFISGLAFLILALCNSDVLAQSFTLDFGDPNVGGARKYNIAYHPVDRPDDRPLTGPVYPNHGHVLYALDHCFQFSKNGPWNATSPTQPGHGLPRVVFDLLHHDANV